MLDCIDLTPPYRHLELESSFYPSNILHIDSFSTNASTHISSLKALSAHSGENREARK